LRGQYRLAVNVSTADGRKESKQFTFNVRENEKKWGTLAAFSTGLFFLGFIAGRVFTSAPKGIVITKKIDIRLESFVIATRQSDMLDRHHS